MIALPPFETGAVHDTVTCESLELEETFRGALGAPNGVAVTEVEAAPGPAEINAVTRNA